MVPVHLAWCSILSCSGMFSASSIGESMLLVHAPVASTTLSAVKVFPSAVATYFAPSDDSGTHGMHRECIRATYSWRNEGPRFDCAFLEKDPDLPGFRGLHAVQVLLLFSFSYNKVLHSCALVS